MDNILAIVLSSAVLTTIITKIFNDHDRKKDYLIEEAKERRNELRNVSRKLGNVEKYDKDTQYILRDLKLCLNAYGNYSSNGDKNDLLRDAHIWQEMEMLEKECKEQIDTDRQKLCFEKHKEKLLQYMVASVEGDRVFLGERGYMSYVNLDPEGKCIGYMDILLSHNKKFRFKNETDEIKYEIEVCKKYGKMLEIIS